MEPFVTRIGDVTIERVVPRPGAAGTVSKEPSPSVSLAKKTVEGQEEGEDLQIFLKPNEGRPESPSGRKLSTSSDKLSSDDELSENYEDDSELDDLDEPKESASRTDFRDVDNSEEKKEVTETRTQSEDPGSGNPESSNKEREPEDSHKRKSPADASLTANSQKRSRHSGKDDTKDDNSSSGSESDEDKEGKNKTQMERKLVNMRRNIREVMNENQLDEETLAAQRQEMERLRRVQEQQRLIREVQRQVAMNRQNNKTQTRVISLLQGNSSSILKQVPGTSGSSSQLRLPNTVLVKLASSSTSVAPAGQKKRFTTAHSLAPTVSRNMMSKGQVHMMTPSVSIAPVRPSKTMSGSDSEGDDDSDRDLAAESVLRKATGKPKGKDVVTISSSSSDDDDCILLSEPSSGDEGDPVDDPTNSGMHTNDLYNIPDEQGRVLVNVGHPTGEPDIFLAPQIARVIKPHQIGGVRFLYDNVVESVERFNTSTGFGCILAHSMGLGKTLQVVSFCDVFLRHTNARTILCIMPINTLQNWMAEFNMWIPDKDPQNSPLAAHGEVRMRHFPLHVLNDSHKSMAARARVVQEWSKGGGVLLLGYELYRQLSLKRAHRGKRRRRKLDVVEVDDDDKTKALLDEMHCALVKPGPDLVICDEGHRIKNSHASISQALKQIRSKRRVVLTGYPLQNNLLEYWCMVDFVRPNYLGTKTEFCNMFERPIQNGQCIDSTPQDIRLMRYRAHVLHSLLEGFVQRRSHSVLQLSLPQKEEYVLLLRMTAFQRKLYDTFMNEVVRTKAVPNPLKAFAVCCKIWNHPDVLYYFLKKRAGTEDVDLDLEETAPAGTVPQPPGAPRPATGTPTPNTPSKRSRGRTPRSPANGRKDKKATVPVPAISTSNTTKPAATITPSTSSSANESGPPTSSTTISAYSMTRPYSTSSSYSDLQYPSQYNNNQGAYASSNYGSNSPYPYNNANSGNNNSGYGYPQQNQQDYNSYGNYQCNNGYWQGNQQSWQGQYYNQSYPPTSGGQYYMGQNYGEGERNNSMYPQNYNSQNIQDNSNISGSMQGSQNLQNQMSDMSGVQTSGNLHDAQSSGTQNSSNIQKHMSLLQNSVDNQMGNLQKPGEMQNQMTHIQNPNNMENQMVNLKNSEIQTQMHLQNSNNMEAMQSNSNMQSQLGHLQKSNNMDNQIQNPAEMQNRFSHMQNSSVQSQLGSIQEANNMSNSLSSNVQNMSSQLQNMNSHGILQNKTTNIQDSSHMQNQMGNMQEQNCMQNQISSMMDNNSMQNQIENIQNPNSLVNLGNLQNTNQPPNLQNCGNISDSVNNVNMNSMQNHGNMQNQNPNSIRTCVNMQDPMNSGNLGNVQNTGNIQNQSANMRNCANISDSVNSFANQSTNLQHMTSVSNQMNPIQNSNNLLSNMTNPLGNMQNISSNIPTQMDNSTNLHNCDSMSTSGSIPNMGNSNRLSGCHGNNSQTCETQNNSHMAEHISNLQASNNISSQMSNSNMLQHFDSMQSSVNMLNHNTGVLPNQDSGLQNSVAPSSSNNSMSDAFGKQNSLHHSLNVTSHLQNIENSNMMNAHAFSRDNTLQMTNQDNSNLNDISNNNISNTSDMLNSNNSIMSQMLNMQGSNTSGSSNVNIPTSHANMSNQVGNFQMLDSMRNQPMNSTASINNDSNIMNMASGLNSMENSMINITTSTGSMNHPTVGNLSNQGMQTSVSISSGGKQMVSVATTMGERVSDSQNTENSVNQSTSPPNHGGYSGQFDDKSSLQSALHHSHYMGNYTNPTNIGSEMFNLSSNQAYGDNVHTEKFFDKNRDLKPENNQKLLDNCNINQQDNMFRQFNQNDSGINQWNQSAGSVDMNMAVKMEQIPDRKDKMMQFNNESNDLQLNMTSKMDTTNNFPSRILENKAEQCSPFNQTSQGNYGNNFNIVNGECNTSNSKCEPTIVSDNTQGEIKNIAKTESKVETNTFQQLPNNFQADVLTTQNKPDINKIESTNNESEKFKGKEEKATDEKTAGVSVENPKSAKPLFDMSKAIVKDDPGIPYDWAVELLKNYVPGSVENSAKMVIFFCILEESMALGDRMLVFSQSLFTLNLIEEYLQRTNLPGKQEKWARNWNYYRLDGSTSALEREKLINEYNSNPNIHLFLVSTRAGSLGINLVGANRVVVFDASWNPCHDTQAVCRVYRYGQKKPCFVYRLVMDNSLEKKIYDRQINKQGMADRVVDECNPDAHLSIKEVTNLCWDNEEDTEVKDFSNEKDKYIDIVMQKVLDKYSALLSKEPFQHESLLVDRKEKKLSQAEKRLAKRSYELEKQANINYNRPQYSYYPSSNVGGTNIQSGLQIRAIRSDNVGTMQKPVASVRPMQAELSSQLERDQTRSTITTVNTGRSRWIPAEVWQRQGMSAQEMTLPLDVVIPTNSPDRASIVLKAGQRVMVLKSPKGIYMQLENGKIIAIRTAFKVSGAGKSASGQDFKTSQGPNSEKSEIETKLADIKREAAANRSANKAANIIPLKNNSSITIIPKPTTIRPPVPMTKSIRPFRPRGKPTPSVQTAAARPYRRLNSDSDKVLQDPNIDKEDMTDMSSWRPTYQPFPSSGGRLQMESSYVSISKTSGGTQSSKLPEGLQMSLSSSQADKNFAKTFPNPFHSNESNKSSDDSGVSSMASSGSSSSVSEASPLTPEQLSVKSQPYQMESSIKYPVSEQRLGKSGSYSSEHLLKSSSSEQLSMKQGYHSDQISKSPVTPRMQSFISEQAMKSPQPEIQISKVQNYKDQNIRVGSDYHTTKPQSYGEQLLKTHSYQGEDNQKHDIRKIVNYQNDQMLKSPPTPEHTMTKSQLYTVDQTMKSPDHHLPKQSYSSDHNNKALSDLHNTKKQNFHQDHMIKSPNSEVNMSKSHMPYRNEIDSHNQANQNPGKSQYNPDVLKSFSNFSNPEHTGNQHYNLSERPEDRMYSTANDVTNRSNVSQQQSNLPKSYDPKNSRMDDNYPSGLKSKERIEVPQQHYNFESVNNMRTNSESTKDSMESQPQSFNSSFPNRVDVEKKRNTAESPKQIKPNESNNFASSNTGIPDSQKNHGQIYQSLDNVKQKTAEQYAFSGSQYSQYLPNSNYYSFTQTPGTPAVSFGNSVYNDNHFDRHAQNSQEQVEDRSANQENNLPSPPQNSTRPHPTESKEVETKQTNNKDNAPSPTSNTNNNSARSTPVTNPSQSPVTYTSLPGPQNPYEVLNVYNPANSQYGSNNAFTASSTNYPTPLRPSTTPNMPPYSTPGTYNYGTSPGNQYDQDYTRSAMYSAFHRPEPHHYPSSSADLPPPPTFPAPFTLPNPHRPAPNNQNANYYPQNMYPPAPYPPRPTYAPPDSSYGMAYGAPPATGFSPFLNPHLHQHSYTTLPSSTQSSNPAPPE